MQPILRWVLQDSGAFPDLPGPDRLKLDVPDPEISEDQLASLFVRQLGLLMSERVTLRAVRVVQEPHKGLRGHPEAPELAPPGPPVRLVELSHPITAGMTTYPGLPGPEITPYVTREASRDLYAPGIEFAIDRITMLGNTGTYLDSPITATPAAPTLPTSRSPHSPTYPPSSSGWPTQAAAAST